MTLTAREVAFLVIRDTFGAPPRASQAAFEYRVSKSELDERDRAFAAELSYGTIKARRLLDWWLKPYIGERAATLPFSIAEILRLGAYQLLCMDGVAAHAAVHETVSLAMRYGHKGTAGLVNAVLRRIEREQPPAPALADFASPLEHLATASSLPTWIVERLAGRFPADELAAICSGVNTRPQHALSLYPKEHGSNEASAFIEAAGGSVSASPFVADTLISADFGPLLRAEAAGFGILQSESAAMPVDLLELNGSENVLELCAGRGNKTLQIASRLQPAGRLEVIERDPKKMTDLANRLAHIDCTNINLRTEDAVFAGGDPVDAMLIDAPCSGLGIIGRHPEARWRKSAEDAVRLSETQLALLGTAKARLRSGGKLVYSVCSPDPCEGEAVVDRFLAREADFERAAIPARYAEFHRGTSGSDLVVAPGVAGRDGFYMAVLQRR